jgi:hypothetical protein
VEIWNRRHHAPARRLVIAIGAAATPGVSPSIGRQAAWFRIHLADSSLATVRDALAGATLEPEQPTAGLRFASSMGISRMVAARTGSTLLVSHLGRLHPDVGLKRAAFFPSAHGRSGVAVGGITVGDTTTLSVRARRSEFDSDAARSLLELVRRSLSEQGSG